MRLCLAPWTNKSVLKYIYTHYTLYTSAMKRDSLVCHLTVRLLWNSFLVVLLLFIHFSGKHFPHFGWQYMASLVWVCVRTRILNAEMREYSTHIQHTQAQLIAMTFWVPEIKNKKKWVNIESDENIICISYPVTYQCDSVIRIVSGIPTIYVIYFIPLTVIHRTKKMVQSQFVHQIFVVPRNLCRIIIFHTWNKWIGIMIMVSSWVNVLDKFHFHFFYYRCIFITFDWRFYVHIHPTIK